MLNFLKKISVLFFAVLAIGIANISSLHAQGEDCNCQTAQNTKGILQTINTFPEIYGKMVAMLLKLTQADNGEAEDEKGQKIESPTPQLIEKFSNYDTAIISADDAKADAMTIFQPTLFTNPDPKVNPPVPANSKTQPPQTPYNGIDQNALTFYNVIKKADPKNPGGDQEREKFVKKYLTTVAGLELYHTSPFGGTWNGAAQDYEAYKRFFNTALATESFNSYILSQLYMQFQNKDALGEAQKKLIEQAKDSDWFTKVGSEPISFVIRQLLLYTSQLLVVQSQMLKNQQEMLYTQAVSNTIMLMIAQYSENQLLRSAKG